MSILQRACFYDDTRGFITFWDWAKVTTTLGAMVEPFTPGLKFAKDVDKADFDPEDEIARIDSIRIMDLNREQTILSGGGHLHGGEQFSTDGR